MTKDAENRTLQPDPAEGSREVIDRELKRMEEKQRAGQSKEGSGDNARSGREDGTKSQS